MSFYSRHKKGFTLIELLVTITIVTVILGVVLSNQSTYTDSAALSNLADQIGLTVSQAQAYGIGVKGFTPGANEFNASYGLTVSLLGSGSPTTYIFFADRGTPSGNQIYDGTWACPKGGASDECVEETNISRGNYIYELCRVRNDINNPYQCDLGRVDISFTRPSPEANITFIDNGGSVMGSDPEFIGARIGLRSPKGATRSVIVYYTGQISVQ